MSRRKIYLPHVECQYRSALGCCVLVEVCPEGRYIYLMWNVNIDQPWDVVFWWKCVQKEDIFTSCGMSIWISLGTLCFGGSVSRRKIYLPHVECQYGSALGRCVLVEVCPEGRYIYLMWNVNIDQPWDVVFWWKCVQKEDIFTSCGMSI